MSSITGLISGGGGGGTPVNGIERLFVGSQGQYTDESGGVWLKTGILIDSDETTYPDAFVLKGDLSTASYDNIFKNVIGPTVYSFTLSSDGLKLYNFSNFYDRIYQQSLTVPFDLTTLVSSSSSYLDVSANIGSSQGLSISPDGTRFFVLDTDNQQIFQFILSTPYDITTGSIAGTFSYSSQGFMYGLWLANNGTKMYLPNSSNLFEYNLSTPYQITTASFVQSQSLNIGGLTGVNSMSPAMNPQGTKLYIPNRVTDDIILQYSMSTPFDISTLSYDNVSFSVSSLSADTWGVYVTSDLTKFFIIDNNQRIFQFSMTQKMGVSENTGAYDYLKLK